MPKHFTNLTTITPQEFSDYLAVARYLKARRAQGIPEQVMAGKTLACIFEKPSLRTRLSFEVAMGELGGRSLYIRGEEVGMGNREPIKDIARVLSGYLHGIMLRVFRQETVDEMAKWATVPVINGLSDTSHPCQALGDFLTMQEHFGTTKDLTVVFIGDANNVSRSLARACLHTGSRFVLACPDDPAYSFSPDVIAKFGDAWGNQVTQIHDPAKAVAGAHVLYSDVWTSMGQEAEKEIRLKAFQGYQINDSLLAKARPDATIMHCLPAHRGEEITDSMMEHTRSLVFPQAENRMHAQKAVLRTLMANDSDKLIAAAREFVAR
jgi:ornithine carbamoyltransferase